MAKRDRGRGGDDGEAPAPFNNPFRGLAGKLGMTSAEPPGAPAATDRRPAPSALLRAGEGDEERAPARAVVRLERKGRGGKEATVVEKLGLAPVQAERWVKELKASLGCGGAVEGAALVLQGDQRERVKALLEQRGVRRVTLG